MKEPIRKLDARRSSAAAKSVRLVVAALILRDVAAESPDARMSREVLICQRRPDQPMSLKWEFPGGKIEPGETPKAALARELQEELGIDATVGNSVATVHHNYRNGAAIEIQFFMVTEFRNELENRIFHDMRWSSLTALPGYDFLSADLSLIRDLADGKLL